MATVILENVPDTFVKKYGKSVNFTSFDITPRKQSFRERMEDPENTTHGPFSGEEFMQIMQSWQ
jgi:hypothetical protein